MHHPALEHLAVHAAQELPGLRGEDPAADRRERRAKDALTFSSRVTLFLAAKAKSWRPRTKVEATRYLTDKLESEAELSKPKAQRLLNTDGVRSILETDLVKVYRAVQRYWKRMLCSRSWAGRRLTWEKYNQIKARTPLLKPKLRLPYPELQALAVL
jgi:hypothetical protein